MHHTIKALTELFMFRCKDRSTLAILHAIAGKPSRWKEGQNLFRNIRRKTLATEGPADQALIKQYLFEECCAKVLYNLSGGPAPFRKNSVDWLIPNALALAHVLGIPDSVITDLTDLNTATPDKPPIPLAQTPVGMEGESG